MKSDGVCSDEKVDRIDSENSGLIDACKLIVEVTDINPVTDLHAVPLSAPPEGDTETVLTMLAETLVLVVRSLGDRVGAQVDDDKSLDDTAGELLEITLAEMAALVVGIAIVAVAEKIAL